MSLRTFRRRSNQWIQAPLGRLAGLLLIVAMVMTGVPSGQIHAHAGGDAIHHHDGQRLSGDLSDEGDHGSSSEPAEDGVLHAHDACTTVLAASTLPAMLLSTLAPAAPLVRLNVSRPPSAARIPPHRPPIA